MQTYTCTHTQAVTDNGAGLFLHIQSGGGRLWEEEEEGEEECGRRGRQIGETQMEEQPFFLWLFATVSHSLCLAELTETKAHSAGPESFKHTG